MNKEISLEERKELQLSMLKEIDAFCKANNIRYSLAFGTLLGAIRHKGFIPWDDDLDIMMPIEDLLKFKGLFKSKHLKYCDIDTEPYYDLVFSRITHTGTFKLEGKNQRHAYGIAIDVYVCIHLPENESIFWKKVCRMQEKRELFTTYRSKVISHFPVSFIPGYTNAIKRLRDYEFEQSKKAKSTKYYMIAGPLDIREKMIYDRDIFQEMTTVQFEDGVFTVIAEYDYFLTKRYGDYMQLPPEEDRHPYHNATYYWK